MHILTDVLQFTLNAATHPPVLLVPCAWKIIDILTCHQLCLCLPIPVPCVFKLWFFRFIVICCVLESQENEITKPGLTMLTKTLARSNSGHFLEPVRHFDFLIRTFPVLWQTSNKKWCYLASVSDFRDFRSNKTWAQQQIKQVVFSLSLGGGSPSGEADAKTSGSQGLKQSENSI